ncbi:hypothetical protein FB451DRAFT_1367057 [Mycena latifolia]|nr:hypothetical protein FB451DRAFT_1367057 [Mycena latifolia]
MPLLGFECKYAQSPDCKGKIFSTFPHAFGAHLVGPRLIISRFQRGSHIQCQEWGQYFKSMGNFRTLKCTTGSSIETQMSRSTGAVPEKRSSYYSWHLTSNSRRATIGSEVTKIRREFEWAERGREFGCDPKRERNSLRTFHQARRKLAKYDGLLLSDDRKDETWRKLCGSKGSLQRRSAISHAADGRLDSGEPVRFELSPEVAGPRLNGVLDSPGEKGLNQKSTVGEPLTHPASGLLVPDVCTRSCRLVHDSTECIVAQCESGIAASHGDEAIAVVQSRRLAPRRLVWNLIESPYVLRFRFSPFTGTYSSAGQSKSAEAREEQDGQAWNGQRTPSEGSGFAL